MTLRLPRNASSPAWGAVACVLAAIVLGSACDGMLGGIELAESEPPPANGAPTSPQVVFPPLQPPPIAQVPAQPTRPEAPGASTPLVPDPAEPAGDAGSGADAGPAMPPPPPPPPPPRPVDVEPPSPLGLIGFEGGGPRLGTCEEGILIGVRPTANPSTDTFGQRLVFLEPICARASLLPGVAGPAAARLTLTRDDALLSWDATEPLLGAPTWEVPDERLVWVPQPETLCPAAAPAVVGFSGAYDPPAEDGSVTASIRSLVLECAPLAIAENGSDVSAAADGHLLISRPDSFAAPGPAQYRSACEGGSVLSQLLIHSGFWLDGFVLGCSALHGE